MPHPDIRLDIVLSDSGQDSVDLSPVENYNFGWGPNFILSPSSLVNMFFKIGNGSLLVVGMELFCKMPHQNIELHKF